MEIGFFGSYVPLYYQEEFAKIRDSNETCTGRFNWEAFLFAPIWVLTKGLWLAPHVRDWMNITWSFEERDVEAVRELLRINGNNLFVTARIQGNVSGKSTSSTTGLSPR